MAEFLIARGADVNARDQYGRTPIHKAAGNGHKQTVVLLMEKEPV